MIDVFELDAFTQHYLVTAIWSSNDYSRTDPTGSYEPPLDENFGISDFSQEALKQAKEECEKFQEENAELLELDGNPETTQGHDFWLTRNHHGCGYWDGDYPEAGDALTEAAQKYGEINIWPTSQDGELNFE